MLYCGLRKVTERLTNLCLTRLVVEDQGDNVLKLRVDFMHKLDVRIRSLVCDSFSSSRSGGFMIFFFDK